MIRAPRLVPSRPMYAFRPESFRVSLREWDPEARVYVFPERTPDADGFYRGSASVDACWFRRRSGVLVASTGRYGFHLFPGHPGVVDDSYLAWVAAHWDNRYGGGCQARLTDDGRFWSESEDPEAHIAELAFLRRMLAGFPDPPNGYDGWWTFQKEDKK